MAPFMIFKASGVGICFSFTRTLVIAFMAYLDNPKSLPILGAVAYSHVQKPSSTLQSAVGAWYETLICPRPTVNQPISSIATMVADLSETKRIHRKGKRLKSREKQSIPLTIKWQKGGRSRSLMNNCGEISYYLGPREKIQTSSPIRSC